MPQSPGSSAPAVSNDSANKFRQAIRQAAEAHGAMLVSIHKSEGLNQRIDVAVSQHNAALGALLNQLKVTPGNPTVVARLVQLLASFHSQHLQLRSQLEQESKIHLAASNVLKARHDTLKNSIGN